MIAKYEFDYNIPFDNDAVGKGDFFLPVTAELLATCEGIGPVVMIKFREVYAVNLMRVISIAEVISQAESIAVAHFSGVEKMPFRVLQLASSIKT
jgi:hypothetical protein